MEWSHLLWGQTRGSLRRTGLRIATDWGKNPPKELWKHQVGAGWSSFAVVGNRLFTQMQWDLQNEATVCYDAETGKQIWVHKDAARFSEKLGGSIVQPTQTVPGTSFGVFADAQGHRVGVASAG